MYTCVHTLHVQVKKHTGRRKSFNTSSRWIFVIHCCVHTIFWNFVRTTIRSSSVVLLARVVAPRCIKAMSHQMLGCRCTSIDWERLLSGEGTDIFIPRSTSLVACPKLSYHRSKVHRLCRAFAVCRRFRRNRTVGV